MSGESVASWRQQSWARIERRRAAWRKVVETDPDTAIAQMRVAGHTISAIVGAIGAAPPYVESVLGRHRLLGPWQSDWRSRVARAA